jgi:hypothetical protein
MWYNCCDMKEGIGLPQQDFKIEPQQRSNQDVQGSSLVAGLVIEPIKQLSKEFLKGILPEELQEGLPREQKQPEITFAPVNQEQKRVVARPESDIKPAPLSTPVSNLARMDRMQSQARINKILQELKKT